MQQVRCALLTLVLGILLVTANCGDEMVVPTSGAAGVVISARGEVKATREGGVARSLQKDDVVYVDDTLSTAAGASVTISITHNRAQWTLDEGEVRGIQESIAWSAARKSASRFAKSEELGTAVAAADSTRTAGNTASTAADTAETAADNETDTDDTEVKTTEETSQTPTSKIPASPGPVLTAVEPEPTGGPTPPGPGRQVQAPKPKTQKNARPKTKAKPRPARDDKNNDPTIGDPAPPEPKLTNESPKRGANVDGESATRSLIQTIANECKDKAGGMTGPWKYTLVVSGGLFKSFQIKSTGTSLERLNTCMEQKLKKRDLRGEINLRGTLKL